MALCEECDSSIGTSEMPWTEFAANRSTATILETHASIAETHAYCYLTRDTHPNTGTLFFNIVVD
jgi:hypothetical protein